MAGDSKRGSTTYEIMCASPLSRPGPHRGRAVADKTSGVKLREPLAAIAHILSRTFAPLPPSVRGAWRIRSLIDLTLRRCRCRCRRQRRTLAEWESERGREAIYAQKEPNVANDVTKTYRGLAALCSNYDRDEISPQKEPPTRLWGRLRDDREKRCGMDCAPHVLQFKMPNQPTDRPKEPLFLFRHRLLIEFYDSLPAPAPSSSSGASISLCQPASQRCASLGST